MIIQIKGHEDEAGNKILGPAENLMFADPSNYIIMTDLGNWYLGEDGWLRLRKHDNE